MIGTGGIVNITDTEVSSSVKRIGVPASVEYYEDDKLVFSMGYYQFCGMVLDAFGSGVLARHDWDIFESDYHTDRILSYLGNEVDAYRTFTIVVTIYAFNGTWTCTIDSNDHPSKRLSTAVIPVEGCRYGSSGARRIAVALAALEYKGNIVLNK